MKNFTRKNQLLSLCGLNCTLCPMFLSKHCGGCGNGNQSCPIAKCSLEHGNVAYCYECKQFKCERYEGIDAYDSFITHKNQCEDLQKAREIGIEQYNKEQVEKAELLHLLLRHYNDGRKKTFYSVAVNLFELHELKSVMRQIDQHKEIAQMSDREQCAYVYDLFKSKANALHIDVTLRKKKKV